MLPRSKDGPVAVLRAERLRVNESPARAFNNAEGHAVDAAFDGSEGEYLAEVTDYDTIILDIGINTRIRKANG